MISEYLMTIIMLPVLLLMTITGMYFLIPAEIRKQKYRIPLRRFLLGFWPFLVSASFVYMLVQSQPAISSFFGIRVNANYTPYIMMIEGDQVSLFQSFASPVLTYIFSFVYLFIFSFLLIFTFLILVYTRNLPALEEFTIAFIIIYLTAFPFYIFVPVIVTGQTLPNVSTLMYDLSPIIDQGVRIVDPNLDNGFPSLHTALSMMAMMIILFRTDLKRYKIFISASTAAILFSILYLGIHWITDLVAGAVLAMTSYYISTRYRKNILEIPHGMLVALEKMLGIVDHIHCSKCSQQIEVIPHCRSVECPGCGETQQFHPLTYD